MIVFNDGTSITEYVTWETSNPDQGVHDPPPPLCLETRPSLTVQSTTTTMPPHVDLVILFSAGVSSINKAQAKENIQQAEEQYTRLLNLLKTSGLHAVGKRGEKLGDLMILVKCPQQKLDVLAGAERFVFRSICTRGRIGGCTGLTWG